MTRVVIAGASGLLGSTLVPVLAERGYEVVPVNRLAGSFTADLADRDDAWRVLDAAEADIVVNLVALTDVDACESDPQRAYLMNARTVENLADWVVARGGRCHLIQVSTDQVYGGSGPHREDLISPINYYALSKYAGELLAGRAAATVLRTNLFGRSQTAARASLSDWLVGVLRRREQARVFRDVLFSPLSLRTLAEMIAVTLEQRVAGTFNLGSRDGMSKADFAFALARALDLPADLLKVADSTEVPPRARRPQDMRMQCEHFESVFGRELPSLESEIKTVRGDYAG